MLDFRLILCLMKLSNDFFCRCMWLKVYYLRQCGIGYCCLFLFGRCCPWPSNGVLWKFLMCCSLVLWWIGKFHVFKHFAQSNFWFKVISLTCLISVERVSPVMLLHSLYWLLFLLHDIIVLSRDKPSTYDITISIFNLYRLCRCIKSQYYSAL